MSTEYDYTKPYMTYNCQGHYKEPGAEWSEPGTGCAQTCDLRHLCWAQVNGVTLDADQMTPLPDMAIAS